MDPDEIQLHSACIDLKIFQYGHEDGLCHAQAYAQTFLYKLCI